MTAACCLREEVLEKERGEKERKANEEDGFRRIEERDHHEREGLLGVGIVDIEGVWGENWRYRQKE